MTTNADIKARVERARELFGGAKWRRVWDDDTYEIVRVDDGNVSLGVVIGIEQNANSLIELLNDLLPALAADCERLQERLTYLDFFEKSVRGWDGGQIQDMETARIRIGYLERELDKQIKANNGQSVRLWGYVNEVTEVAKTAEANRKEILSASATSHRHSLAQIATLEQARRDAEQDRDREKERADWAEQSLAETAQLMVHAKDFARNAAPILRLHKQLVAAAQRGDEAAVNGIVAEMALMEVA